MAPSGDAVDLRNVSLSYLAADGQPLEAVAPTTLTIPAGQFVSLVGPSGCGKTSLLRVIAGLHPPPPAKSRSSATNRSKLSASKSSDSSSRNPPSCPGATSKPTSGSDASSTPPAPATASPSIS